MVERQWLCQVYLIPRKEKMFESLFYWSTQTLQDETIEFDLDNKLGERVKVVLVRFTRYLMLQQF
jgi:hypothetical protein